MRPEFLHIHPTDKTPEVIMNPDGIIWVKGKALVENRTKIPDEIENWIRLYIKDPSDTTEIKIALEYLNSIGTRMLVSAIRELLKVTLLHKKITITWYYEKDDDDILERAQFISMNFRLPFVMVRSEDLSHL